MLAAGFADTATLSNLLGPLYKEARRCQLTNTPCSTRSWPARWR